MLIGDRANGRSHRTEDRGSTEQSVTGFPQQEPAYLSDQNWLSGIVRKPVTQ